MKYLILLLILIFNVSGSAIQSPIESVDIKRPQTDVLHADSRQKKIPNENSDDNSDQKPETFSNEDPLFFGFWDHHISGSTTLPDDWLPHVNIGKSMSRSVRPITRQNLPAIMHLGNLHNETQAERRKRIESIDQYVHGEVPIIHFIDEPLSKGVTGPELDELVDYARSLYGNRFKYAYTINAAELYYPHLRAVQSYAQDFDYVLHQAYPYRTDHEAAYLRTVDDSKSGLFASLDLRLQTLSEKIPNSDYWIVAQGFGDSRDVNGKWRTPVATAPEWYTQWALSQPRIKGILFWKFFSSSPLYGIEDLDEEYQDNIKKSFEMIRSAK